MFLEVEERLLDAWRASLRIETIENNLQ